MNEFSPFTWSNGKRYFGADLNLEVITLASERGSQGIVAFVYNHGINRMETLKIYSQEWIRTHEVAFFNELSEDHYPHFSSVHDIGFANGHSYARLGLGRGLSAKSQEYSLDDFMAGKILTFAQIIYRKSYSTSPLQQEVLNSLSHSPMRSKIKLLSSIADLIKIMHERNIVHNDLKPEHIILLAPVGSDRKSSRTRGKALGESVRRRARRITHRSAR